MGRHREEVIGSYVRHDEVYRCTVVNEGGPVRWECSCGAVGAWSASRTALVVWAWWEHMLAAHDDVDPLDELDP